MKDADELRSKLILDEREKFKFDRRVALRTPVHSGAMDIRWKNSEGELKSGAALQIPMNAVLFEAGDFDEEGLDSIVCKVIGINPAGQTLRYPTKGGGQDRGLVGRV